MGLCVLWCRCRWSGMWDVGMNDGVTKLNDMNDNQNPDNRLSRCHRPALLSWTWNPTMARNLMRLPLHLWAGGLDLLLQISGSPAGYLGEPTLEGLHISTHVWERGYAQEGAPRFHGLLATHCFAAGCEREAPSDIRRQPCGSFCVQQGPLRRHTHTHVAPASGDCVSCFRLGHICKVAPIRGQ